MAQDLKPISMQPRKKRKKCTAAEHKVLMSSMSRIKQEGHHKQGTVSPHVELKKDLFYQLKPTAMIKFIRTQELQWDNKATPKNMVAEIMKQVKNGFQFTYQRRSGCQWKSPRHKQHTIPNNMTTTPTSFSMLTHRRCYVEDFM